MSEDRATPGPLAGVVLAAGEGKRMMSDLPKVLHSVVGKPLLGHVLDRLEELGAERTVVIVGHGRERVIELCRERGVSWAVQDEQLGTAHAFEQALPKLEGFVGTVLILCGDTPVLTDGTLRRLLEVHAARGAWMTVLSADLDDPTGYGRVVRNADGDIERIVEHRDASEEERALPEINTAIYALTYPDAARYLERIDRENQQGEFYLTDLVALLRREGHRVAVLKTDDPREAIGVNTVDQLREAEAIHQELTTEGKIAVPRRSGN